MKKTIFILLFLAFGIHNKILAIDADKCAKVYTLMYHHIQPEKLANELGQEKLTVTPFWLEQHMNYLRENNYTVIKMNDLINFFDNNINLPDKSVLLTFDDAYEDNFLFAYPILKKYQFMSTIFVPTGLLGMIDYLKEFQLEKMAGSKLVYFGNHTWSHHSSAGSMEVLNKEIGLADKYLNFNGFNLDKVFAYPYGKSSDDAKEILNKYGYKLAFTTKHGTEACANNRLELPRIRVGNATLTKYGL